MACMVSDTHLDQASISRQPAIAKILFGSIWIPGS
jgi:hypothetical protein